MKRLVILYSLFLLLASSSVARAAEPPLSVNAYVSRGGVLIVTVRADAPTSAQIAVNLPTNWITDTPLVVSVGVRDPTIRTWRASGPGLGIIGVVVRDARGNVARATAYGEGPREPAPAALLPGRVWIPIARR